MLNSQIYHPSHQVRAVILLSLDRQHTCAILLNGDIYLMGVLGSSVGISYRFHTQPGIDLVE